MNLFVGIVVTVLFGIIGLILDVHVGVEEPMAFYLLGFLGGTIATHVTYSKFN